MKFTLNGALTIGTLDGANVEIREEVGAENFFLFGLTAEDVERVKREGYRPGRYIDADAELRGVLDMIGDGHFSRGDATMFQSLLESLRQHDPFLVCADYADYVACQEKVSLVWTDAARWTRMAILNVARAGKFSSDRSIREYCSAIWGARPVPVQLEG